MPFMPCLVDVQIGTFSLFILFATKLCLCRTLCFLPIWIRSNLAFWYPVFNGGRNQRGTVGLLYLFLIGFPLHVVFFLSPYKKALG